MLLGLIRADGGAVEIFGEPFRREVLGRIGALVEMPSLYSHLTGRENLEVTRRQIGTPKTAIERSLATVGLENDANRLVREYSLGMRQRLGLALALLVRIGAAEAGKAAAFLRASGFDVRVDTEEGSGRLVRSGAAEAALARGMSGRDVRSPYIGVVTDDAERVNRLLVENGHGVYHLSFERESSGQ